MENSPSSLNITKRTICLPVEETYYEKIVEDANLFRQELDKLIKRYPELFPPEIGSGYRMKDIRFSKKLENLCIRRIKVGDVSYSILPSFVMPYMTGFTSTVEYGLFLRKFGVPYWALAFIFGRYASYWYRLETSLGRNSLVGTTVRSPEKLPEHLSADEKHTRVCGDKAYIATTVGGGCFLGASVSSQASEEELEEAYGVFKREVSQIDSDYSPKTVNTDAWKATRSVWKKLFPKAVLLLCFLHVYLWLRNRSKKKYKEIFHLVSDKLWNCYQAENRRRFSQRVRRLCDWAKKVENVPAFMKDKLNKLRKKLNDYAGAYRFAEAHRTSNMLDRLMQGMKRHLYSTRYFHGKRQSAELNIRGWALIQNFAPFNPKTLRNQPDLQSPAERLNQFRYHQNWLQNLLISASLGGGHTPPQKPT